MYFFYFLFLPLSIQNFLPSRNNQLFAAVFSACAAGNIGIMEKWIIPDSVCFSTTPRWITMELDLPPVPLTAPSRSLTSGTEDRYWWQTSGGEKQNQEGVKNNTEKKNIAYFYGSKVNGCGYVCSLFSFFF